MRRKIIRVRAHIDWIYEQDKDTDQWIAECPALQLMAQGNSHNDLTKYIYEIMEDFIRDQVKGGTLKQYLKECGFNEVFEVPQIDPNEVDSTLFDVPFNLLDKQQNDSQQCSVH